MRSAYKEFLAIAKFEQAAKCKLRKAGVCFALSLIAFLKLCPKQTEANTIS